MNKRKDLISSDVRYLCLSKGKQTHVRLNSMTVATDYDTAWSS
jgi:hypothetical protein